MASYNRVILVGNLTRDPELKYIPSGAAVAEIGLAVNDRRKTASGEWIEETTFVDVTLWSRTAEIASEYLSKGSQVLIEGRLKLDTWEKDGKKNYKLRVVGEKMTMLGSKGGGSGGGGGEGGQRRAAGQGGGGQGSSSQGGGQNSGQGTRGARPANQSAPAYDESEYASSDGDYGSSGGGGSGDDIPF